MRCSVPALWCVASLWSATAAAQELEPRAYAPSPIGTNFVVVVAARSHGDVLVDPSIPLADVSATLDTIVFGYGRTFALANRQALFVAAVPMASLDASGRVGENGGSVARSGFADARMKMSIGLIGSPALAPAEFARASRRLVLGASISVVTPTGRYDKQHLINLGSNRWSVKPELGISYPLRRWTLESYAGVWFFTANDAFYPGEALRKQDAMFAVQAHATYEVARHAWAAFDATWYSGGASMVNGVRKDDRQENTRIGGTLSLPIGRRYSMKLTYSTGATTRSGADFNTVGVSWQAVIF